MYGERGKIIENREIENRGVENRDIVKWNLRMQHSLEYFTPKENNKS
jgi:hypothetical protein